MHDSQNPNSQFRKRQTAFTLVELLVVIGIIAVLVGLLLPSLSRAREQSKAVACLANLRTIGASLVMYTDAHKGWFPLNSHSTSGGAWIDMLYKYGTTPAARRCPSDDRVPAWATTYGTNNLTVETDPPKPPQKYPKVTMIRRSSDVVYASELAKNSDHLHVNNWATLAYVESEWATTQHRGHPNALFCDGHAAPIRYSSFKLAFPDVNPFDPAKAR